MCGTYQWWDWFDLGWLLDCPFREWLGEQLGEGELLHEPGDFGPKALHHVSRVCHVARVQRFDPSRLTLRWAGIRLVDRRHRGYLAGCRCCCEELCDPSGRGCGDCPRGSARGHADLRGRVRRRWLDLSCLVIRPFVASTGLSISAEGILETCGNDDCDQESACFFSMPMAVCISTIDSEQSLHCGSKSAFSIFLLLN